MTSLLMNILLLLETLKIVITFKHSFVLVTNKFTLPKRWIENLRYIIQKFKSGVFNGTVVLK